MYRPTARPVLLARWTWDALPLLLGTGRQWPSLGRLGEPREARWPRPRLSLLPPPQPLWGLGDNQRAEPPTMEPQPSQGVLWGGKQGSLWTRTPKGWLAHKLQLRILTAITFGRPIWECQEVLKNAFPLLGRFLF